MVFDDLSTLFHTRLLVRWGRFVSTIPVASSSGASGFPMGHLKQAKRVVCGRIK